MRGIIPQEMLSPFLDRGGPGSGTPAALQQRDYVPVVLELFDRTWVRAKLSLPTLREGPRVRPYDLIERPTERTLRFIEVEITTEKGRVIHTKSIIIQKEAIMFMYEQSEEEP